MKEGARWIPLNDELAAPERMTEADLARLEELWREALRELGCEAPADRRFFERRDGCACLDQELLLSALTEGRPRSFLRRARLQWRVESYLAFDGRGKGPGTEADPEGSDATRVRSLALGLCQQALLMRLPAHTELQLARWLTQRSEAPRLARATLERLDRVQRLRDALSWSWRGFFDGCESHGGSESREEGGSGTGGAAETLGEPGTEAGKPRPPVDASPRSWRGLPVCPGEAEGAFWIVPETPAVRPPGGLPDDVAVLIFRRARPDAVEWYPFARAVVFAQGGVLSHACSVARETGIPCLTGVGAEGWEALRRASAQGHARARVTVSSEESRIELIP